MHGGFFRDGAALHGLAHRLLELQVPVQGQQADARHLGIAHIHQMQGGLVGGDHLAILIQ